MFDEARAVLEASGFNADRITTKIISGARSRAAAVAQEAVGRRLRNHCCREEGAQQGEGFPDGTGQQ